MATQTVGQRTIFITGAAGYVGEMLCEQFAARPDVRMIVALDKEEQTERTKNIANLTYLRYDLADDGWQTLVGKEAPDTIIHAAWQIRSLYGRAEEQWRLNVTAAEKLFAFAITTETIKKLIHFSTAAVYGAPADNSLEHLFTEAEAMRTDEYAYATEKRVVEEKLRALYEQSLAADTPLPQITIFRPAAITGPRGRYSRIRFGLQSALQGTLTPSPLNRIVMALTSVVPVTAKWVRQFIHEDDVVDAVAQVVFAPSPWTYEVFNLTPTGAPVFPLDMAQAMKKRMLLLSPHLIQLAFWCFWHGTHGTVPTGPGVWRFYAYPIVMSGEKLAAVYPCQYDSVAAISSPAGRYEKEIGETMPPG